MRFRIFEQDLGWSEWRTWDRPRYVEYSNVVALEIVEKWRPDLREPDTTDGHSLTNADPEGGPGNSGVCVVSHAEGIVLVEYEV